TYGFEAMEATESKLGTAQLDARLITTVLDALNTKMQAAQRKLRNAVADAEEAGHTVRDDGWVEPKRAIDPKYHNDPDYEGLQQRANAGLGGFRARIDEALTSAETASYEAAELLHQIDPFDLDKRYGGASAQEDAARTRSRRRTGGPVWTRRSSTSTWPRSPTRSGRWMACPRPPGTKPIGRCWT
ncbi:hypothetical protein ACFWNS_39030, partial [Streptomyces sp. NPDC058418]